MDIVTYALCKKIAESAVSGIKNLSVSGTTLTIETNDGQTIDIVFPTPADGVSIVGAYIDNYRHLICDLSDGSSVDAGEVPMYIPQKGVDYYTEQEKDELVQEVTDEVVDYFSLDLII